MKSFVAYPSIMDKKSFFKTSHQLYSEKLLTHYGLFEKGSLLEGCVVKCGITLAEGMSHFAIFSSLLHIESIQKIVAFEKIDKSLSFDNPITENGALLYKAKPGVINVEKIKDLLLKKGIAEPIDFIRGNVWDTIPEYLMRNPDLKIAYLNIDMNNFNGALTALQFFLSKISTWRSFSFR